MSRKRSGYVVALIIGMLGCASESESPPLEGDTLASESTAVECPP
jgi:hypothetical protein